MFVVAASTTGLAGDRKSFSNIKKNQPKKPQQTKTPKPNPKPEKESFLNSHCFFYNHRHCLKEGSTS